MLQPRFQPYHGTQLDLTMMYSHEDRKAEMWTYVKPVERFMPARIVDTGWRSAGVLLESRAGERTQDSIECIVSQSSNLSPQTKR